MRMVLQNVVFTLLLLAAYSFFDRGRHSSLQRQVDDMIERMIPRDRIAQGVFGDAPPSLNAGGETSPTFLLV